MRISCIARDKQDKIAQNYLLKLDQFKLTKNKLLKLEAELTNVFDDTIYRKILVEKMLNNKQIFELIENIKEKIEKEIKKANRTMRLHEVIEKYNFETEEYAYCEA